MSKRAIAHELHKPARRTFKRRHVAIKGLNDLFQSDLIEMIPHAHDNNGYKYILIVIDVYSKYAWARPLKNKTGKEVTSAMSDILSGLKKTPKNLQTDFGTEYYNTHFKTLMVKFKINHYSVYSTMKACIAERFIRTLKGKLFYEFSARGSYKWLDILPALLNTYNNTVHSTIKMKPADVKDNSLLGTVYNYGDGISRKKPKFKVGDFVRISKHKKIFQKGYLPSWTTEIFKIRNVQLTSPPTYLLEDLTGSEIVGAFYTEEIQETKHPDIYLVERVLKKKGSKVYVKWLGFPNSENSWIDVSDML